MNEDEWKKRKEKKKGFNNGERCPNLKKKRIKTVNKIITTMNEKNGHTESNAQ